MGRLFGLILGVIVAEAIVNFGHVNNGWAFAIGLCCGFVGVGVGSTFD